MPIAPTIPPVDAVPTPPASLAHQFDRRCGAEFNRGCLCRGERAACAETDARATKPASVCNSAHFSLHRGQVARMCATNDLYNLRGRKSEPPALRWDCQRYVRALAFAAGDPVPSLTA
jgi:hypothetical protein